MNDPRLHDLRPRVERLERELRWWRLGALGAVVLLIVLGAAPRGTTLEAERLVIRDAKGTVRAALGTETEQRGWPSLPAPPGLPKKPPPEPKFGLYVYREDGAEAARLNLTSDGEPQLVLSDRQQKASASIGAFDGMAQVGVNARKKGLPEFVAEFEVLLKRAEREKWSANDERWSKLEPSTEEVNLDLTALHFGEFSVEGVAKSGRILLSGGATETVVSIIGQTLGSGFDIHPRELRLRDPGGMGRLFLALSDNDSPFLALHDKDGRSRAVLGYSVLEGVRTGSVERRGESSLILFDRDGKVLWRVP